MLPLAMNNRWRAALSMVPACCLLFLAALHCEAQGNLVPNWSFEEREGDCDSLICCFNIGSRPIHWFTWQNSSDYFNACNPGTGLDSLVDVPQNGWTYQYPWDGDAYVGVYCYDAVADEYREYVGAELTEPLVVGCSYQLRFRTNPAYGGNYWLQNAGTASNNIGMLLTTVSNAWPGITGPPFPYRNFAHLRTLAPVSDTLGWTVVEGIITADSAYRYVVLGNFFPDSLTIAEPVGNPDPWTGVTYYLFDGVEVIPLDPICHGVGVGEHDGIGPHVLIIDDRINVRWSAGPIEAEVMDIAGREVVIRRIVGDGAGSIPAPGAQGMFILRLFQEGRSFNWKFVTP